MNKVGTNDEGSSTVDLPESNLAKVDPEIDKRPLSKELKVITKRRVIRGKRNKVKEPSTASTKNFTSKNKTHTIEDETSAKGKAERNVDDGIEVVRKDFTKEEIWQIWRKELIRRLKAGDKCCVWESDKREYYVYPKTLLEIAKSINRDFNDDFWINKDLRSLIHRECFRFFKK